MDQRTDDGEPDAQGRLGRQELRLEEGARFESDEIYRRKSECPLRRMERVEELGG